MSATDSSSPPDAGTTPLAVRATKPSRFTRVYAGTASKPVTGNRAETAACSRNALQQFTNQRFLFFQFRHRRIDFRATEIVYRKALHDFPFSTSHADWE